MGEHTQQIRPQANALDAVASPAVNDSRGTLVKRIFLVQGNCGEYSDYREWVICAYHDEAKAKDHARLAKEWREQKITYEMPYDERAKLKNPYDPDDYYGVHQDTDWTAYGVEIRGALPKASKRKPSSHASAVSR